MVKKSWFDNNRCMSNRLSSHNKIKILATSLLIFCAALFVFSSLYVNVHPIMPWLRAFSEAGMVGALADWFAVTALFRRPLGLPIPHTGIIPRNQARIGNTLGRFIYENFLTPATLAPKLKEAKLAEKMGNWLLAPANARVVASQIKDFAATALVSMKKNEVSNFLKRIIPSIAGQLQLGPLIAELLVSVRNADTEGKLFNEALSTLEKLLSEHQGFIKELVSGELPWYVPGFVKNHLYTQVTEAIKKTIVSMRADREHLLRKQITHLLDKAVTSLREDAKWEERLQSGVAALCSQSTLLEYLETMSATLVETLKKDESKLFQETIERVLCHTARFAIGNPAFSKQADDFAAAFVLRMVHDYGANVGGFIENTISSWDSSHLVSKIENEVGRDLQFIRINGTLVGGLVGILLYFVTEFLFKSF